ncbi:DNA-directed RNA polymerase subunit epsilon [Natrarchaeobaculum aegyptiacum]|uniref:DNA-directed RNA polymerase subunit epsilon n=1 Tax=Natrarchaeobaculum aegyptiacum TaxID=745377 RepID=A0A2Z2HX40_9EURY|nr:DNA-directed RNA polymerase subunit epsilon [Natrarchaeobaculum aegyptiacum]ARS89524.1 DNA-directed RNA polymerase subunit epsilon [Natrarchaeobaculum aegyptiacum]
MQPDGSAPDAGRGEPLQTDGSRSSSDLRADGGVTPEQESTHHLETRPGAGSLSRAAAQRDATVRRWGVVTPSATVIGRAESPDGDLSESVRRLHDEQHAATPGYSERAHHLDRLRTTQALCNALEVTPWQRDLALGVMDEIDLTEFGSQRAIEKVALVVIRHVVDVDRRQYFGLDDVDVQSLSADRMEELFAEYRAHDVTDEPTFKRLASKHGLDTTSLNRLRRVLKEQLEDELPAYGHNPYRDPNLPVSVDRDADADADVVGADSAADPSNRDGA